MDKQLFYQIYSVSVFLDEMGYSSVWIVAPKVVAATEGGISGSSLYECDVDSRKNVVHARSGD